MPGTRHEELHTARRGDLDQRGVLRRDIERRNAKHPLTVHAERLARRRDQLDAGTRPDQRVGEFRHCVDHVLAVVEEHQHAAGRERLDEHVAHRPRRVFAHPKNGGDGRGDAIRLTHRSELNQPHTVPGTVERVRRDLQC